MRRRTPADRNASLLGLALAEKACESIGRAFDPAALCLAPRGRPELPGGPAFSISHAGAWVAAVAARSGLVGLDLEPAGAVAPAVLRRVLAPSLHARLAAGALDPTHAWVQIEAVVKATGLGVGAAARVELRDDRATLDGECLHLLGLDLDPGYVAYLARSPGSGEPSLRRHEASDFAPLP
jgi:hypothetical protein